MNRREKTAFEDRKDVASAFDCTGLIPAMPYEEDTESLEDEAHLYAIHAPETKDITEDDGGKEHGTGTHAAHRGEQG